MVFVYSVSVPGYAGSLAASLPGGGAAAWERLGAELLLSGLVAAAHFAGMERRWTGATPALLGAAYCAASFVSVSLFCNNVNLGRTSTIIQKLLLSFKSSGCLC